MNPKDYNPSVQMGDAYRRHAISIRHPLGQTSVAGHRACFLVFATANRHSNQGVLDNFCPIFDHVALFLL